MQVLKKIVWLSLFAGFTVFGALYPDDYLNDNSIHFLISFYSFLVFQSLIFSEDVLKKHFLGLKVMDLLFAFDWKNKYQFVICALFPFLFSFPAILAKDLSLFVIIFSTCYFQSIIVLVFLNCFFQLLKKNSWHIISSLLLLSIIVSDKINYGEYLLFNPLLGAAFIPYHFNFTLNIIHVLIAAAVAYFFVLVFILLKRIKKDTDTRKTTI